MPAAARTAPLLERAVLGLLAAYLLAQCFSLPVLAAGPSWALWPTLPDLLVWAALGCALLYHRPPGAAWRPVGWGLALLVALAFCSFGLLFVMRDARLASAVPFGLFQLYKLVQALAVFGMVSRLPLRPTVLARWGRAALPAFVVMVVSIAWTYFSPALPRALGQVLPHGAGVSGPWESYYLHNEPGLGMVGYNHGYVALQVTLLSAAVLMLRPRSSNVWVLGAALAACFLSGSRAGLAGCLLFALLEWRRLPVRAGLLLALLGVAGLAAAPWLDQQLGGLAARQSTLLEAGNSGNLAGRSEIWHSYFQAFAEDPYRLLVGSGFGSAINNNSNAHSTPIQVLYETGVAGVVALGLLFWALFGQLRARRTLRAGVALNLLVGLALTALTQETFYPNSAFSGSLPLLAFVLALALTPERGSAGSSEQ
ncbi:O-antigen ligase family protein [Deinococcus carri]|uniref:O-antigen ligase family protein n=1 Tax=Deinococcus carri TaxID=1211323 RepID=UPI0031ED7FF4